MNREKVFLGISALKRLKIYHTEEKSYSCETCEKAFSQQSTLTIHYRIHTS